MSIQASAPNKHLRLRILLVEDEADFREGLVELLTLEGFNVDGVGDIAQCLTWLSANECDILILDRNLPDGDGLDIIRSYKPSKPIATILLTCEGQVHDRIAGMDADADYYLVKPFPSDELIAILHRLKRRLVSHQLDSSQWTLNSIRWEITTPNQLEIELTKNEFALLSCFISKPGQTITREQIIVGLGFNPDTYDTRRLEVMLRRLRKKVEEAGVAKFPLQTIYGVGLAFNSILKLETKS